MKKNEGTKIKLFKLFFLKVVFGQCFITETRNETRTGPIYLLSPTYKGFVKSPPIFPLGMSVVFLYAFTLSMTFRALDFFL